MKKLLYIVLVVFISCQGTPEKKEPKENGIEGNSSPVSQKLEVLNPNLASLDQLLKVVPENIAFEIQENRPFLNTSNFIRLLTKSLNKEEVSEIVKILFLPINLNSASEQEILSVPGVGEKMAHEFDEYRPYKNIEQFRREIGKYVNAKQVGIYESYVFVPVNLNRGTKEEFLSIPGVGNKMAHEFDEYKPYKNIEQFKREIGKYVNDKELLRLQRYVTL